MPTHENTRIHYRTCNLCEALCGIEVAVQGDQILTIRGDKDDPFSRGHLCPKAVALQDIHSDKNRLKHPVRRTQEGWQRMGWDEAFDEVAHRLKSIQTQHGRNAVGIYLGNPTVHNYGSLLFGPGFVRSLHTRNRFSATSVDQLAHHFAAYFMFGHQLLLPIPDLDRTDFLLILGGNPAVSNGSLMTAPDVVTRLKAIRGRGGKVIVVDPRRTETAQLADRHLFIRPGSDVLLLLALLHVLFAEGRSRPGRLAEFTDGLDTIGQLVAEFSPEKVESLTGVAAEAARGLAREFASARSAVCYGRVGVSMQEFGAACQWLINVMNIVTGNLDRPGGAMFTRPAFDAVAAPAALAPRGSFARWHSRVRKLPEFGGELPVATLAEEILTEGPGQIKAMIISAGNPVLSTPNGRQLDGALGGLQFMAAIDFYINETTRHAHIILPPTSALEHENYDLAFHLLAIRNTTKYSPALFKPAVDTRHDWEIFLELQRRMEAHRSLFRTMMAPLQWGLVRRLGPQRLLDLGLRLGPYGARFNPLSGGLTLSKLKRAPHGMDLGPLQSCLPERLWTPAKHIQLAPDVLVRDLDRIKERLRSAALPNPGYDLRLIGRRQLRSNNSWMHNSWRLVKGRPQCTLLIHPGDAARHHLINGQRVWVHSRVGRIEIPAEITDDIMPGVVSIPHGWGHDRPGILQEVARAHAGASINDLTDELAVDPLCGTAAFSGIPVRIEAIEK